jgi:hypothetical protein
MGGEIDEMCGTLSMICLIKIAMYLLAKLIQQLEKDFWNTAVYAKG